MELKWNFYESYVDILWMFYGTFMDIQWMFYVVSGVNYVYKF